jgi:hypothetical protein
MLIQTYYQFEAVARYRLYADYEKPQFLDSAWPNGPMRPRSLLFNTIYAKSRDEKWDALASIGPNRSEMTKEYAWVSTSILEIGRCTLT